MDWFRNFVRLQAPGIFLFLLRNFCGDINSNSKQMHFMVETSCLKAALGSGLYTCTEPTTPYFSRKPGECAESEIPPKFSTCNYLQICEQFQLHLNLKN